MGLGWITSGSTEQRERQMRRNERKHTKTENKTQHEIIQNSFKCQTLLTKFKCSSVCAIVLHIHTHTHTYLAHTHTYTHTSLLEALECLCHLLLLPLSAALRKRPLVVVAPIVAVVAHKHKILIPSTKNEIKRCKHKKSWRKEEKK